MTKTNLSAALRAAFPHTIPIMTGYLAVGLAYGVLMASKGYNALWSGFVSAFAFCGSMQYVAITLLTSAFDPVQAFLLSLMVNARHLFYFAMSFLTWLYWVVFSMLGGLVGSLLTFDTTGIDFALTALFVVLFIEQVTKRENRASGGIGLVCSVAALAVFGADNMVIPAMALTMAVLLGRRKLCA